MLMAAAFHKDAAAHGPSSATTATASPQRWLPLPVTVLLPKPVPDHHPDLNVTTPSTKTATTAPAQRQTAARRIGRRRPRPSRGPPTGTTYINADPASFRRMVHQVTGTDDGLPSNAAPPATLPETLCRPTPSRALPALLPTLDTSAFLLGAARGSSGSARLATSTALEADQLEAGGGVGLPGHGGSVGLLGGSGGFPTLESSWHPPF